MVWKSGKQGDKPPGTQTAPCTHNRANREGSGHTAQSSSAAGPNKTWGCGGDTDVSKQALLISFSLLRRLQKLTAPNTTDWLLKNISAHRSQAQCLGCGSPFRIWAQVVAVLGRVLWWKERALTCRRGAVSPAGACGELWHSLTHHLRPAGRGVPTGPPTLGGARPSLRSYQVLPLHALIGDRSSRRENIPDAELQLEMESALRTKIPSCFFLCVF